jgi:hypothetical protein
MRPKTNLLFQTAHMRQEKPVGVDRVKMSRGRNKGSKNGRVCNPGEVLPGRVLPVGASKGSQCLGKQASSVKALPGVAR